VKRDAMGRAIFRGLCPYCFAVIENVLRYSFDAGDAVACGCVIPKRAPLPGEDEIPF
jgi:hypothetical protein